VRVELDQVWQHPDQEYSADLALADAAVYWLRMPQLPVHDNQGYPLGSRCATRLYYPGAVNGGVAF